MKKSFHLSPGSDGASDDVRREIELHLELRAREFEAQGMSPEAARKAALEAFGDRGVIESEVRTLRESTVRVRGRRQWLGELSQDLRVALRGLRRTPGFTLVAVLTLAVGIGANSALFSVLRSVLLRPLPYADAGQLVQLWSDTRQKGRAQPEWLTPPDFVDWRDGNRTFSGMAAYQGWAPDLTGTGEPEALGGILVSGNYFNVLQVSPALGRLLTMADDDAGAERVVVLSDAVWRRRFGSDPGMLGKSITLNGEPWTVVGVLPREFRAPLLVSPEVYRAMRRPATSGCGRGCYVLRGIGRMKPGVTLQQAQADVGGIAARLARAFPATNEKVGAWLIPLHEQITGKTRDPLLALGAAVGFVLLIACVNLANLLLVRGAGRARELGVRAALGAGRSRLVRQLLAESGVLAVLGGALGLALGAAGSGVLSTLVPEGVRRIQTVQVNGAVVGYTAAIAILSGLLFGLLPSLSAAKPDLMGALRSGGRETGRRGGAVRNGLVVAELAFSVVLLVGAGLLFRSFLLMQQVDLGFRSKGVVLVSIGFPRVRYPNGEAAGGAVQSLLDRLHGNPAIASAEVTDLPPLNAGGDQDVTAIPVGEPQRADAPESVWYRSVSPGYLPVMQMRLVSGRYFSPEDRQGSPQVGIVNQEAARRFWPGKDPIGRILAQGSDSAAPRLTIIGVVASARQDGPNQPYKVELFAPIAQAPSRGVVFVLEPARDAESAVGAFRQALKEVDPLVPVAGVDPIEKLVGDAVALPRLYALLIGIFAAAAVLLAVLGVYGVMAYAVAQRQREIGVRLALGAAPFTIQRLVLGQGARLALLGTVIGLLAAAGAGRLMGTLLFQVSAFDLPTFALVPLVLGSMALIACWLPARRAMRVDPLVAIRED
ncbi:MAG TPA: ABC transporter permease [Gemmatimonadales bacterium]|nr:ABC transporter permease [Gemmatimonadales bacterium]